MKEIDIHQYFSVGQPIISPQIPSNSNKENSINRSKLPTIDPSMGGEDDIQQRDSPKYSVKSLPFFFTNTIPIFL